MRRRIQRREPGEGLFDRRRGASGTGSGGGRMCHGEQCCPGPAAGPAAGETGGRGRGRGRPWAWGAGGGRSVWVGAHLIDVSFDHVFGGFNCRKFLIFFFLRTSSSGWRHKDILHGPQLPSIQWKRRYNNM